MLYSYIVFSSWGIVLTVADVVLKIHKFENKRKIDLNDFEFLEQNHDAFNLHFTPFYFDCPLNELV